MSKKRGNIGMLKLSICYSTMLETRELDTQYNREFNYKPYLSKMNSGDLIAYDAPGIIGTSIKVVTDSPYSHVGLVLRIPNKWTEERELYVMEIGRNNGMLSK